MQLLLITATILITLAGAIDSADFFGCSDCQSIWLTGAAQDVD